MPEEVAFRLQYVGRSRELCLRSTKYVYVFIGAYYPPSMQCYVSYVVMMLPRTTTMVLQFKVYFIHCVKRKRVVSSGGSRRKIRKGSLVRRE